MNYLPDPCLNKEHMKTETKQNLEITHSSFVILKKPESDSISELKLPILGNESNSFFPISFHGKHFFSGVTSLAHSVMMTFSWAVAIISGRRRHY